MSRVVVNAQTGQVTVDEAFTGTDFTPAPTVPTEVTKLQLVRACRLTEWGESDLWTVAKAALAQADAAVQEDWDLAVAIPRDDPGFVGLATALQATSQQIDAVFILAATQ
jgi:hypothetical protein